MKQDLTKTYKSYYTARTSPEVIALPEAQYLSLAGKGDPSGDEFGSNIESLYPVAYAVKFACKAAGNDFVVPKLECQWWYDEKQYPGVRMEDAPVKVPRSEWRYRLLIRMPTVVTQKMVSEAIATTLAKKGATHAKDITLYTIAAGRVAQLLHVGPFDTEPESLLKLYNYMQANKLQQGGLHHEIYLSDLRKTAPGKLRTILREPVA